MSRYERPSASARIRRAPKTSPAGKVRDCTPDGKRIVYWWDHPTRFALFDPATQQSTDLVRHPKFDVHGAELSPDQNWVAFNTPILGRTPLWIAHMRNGISATEKDWIPVSADRDERPWWSRDGNLLYVVSRRDGAKCIWALDPRTRRPVGVAVAVRHIYGARIRMPSESLALFGPAILSHGLIFGLLEETGNVWVGEQKE